MKIREFQSVFALLWGFSAALILIIGVLTGLEHYNNSPWLFACILPVAILFSQMMLSSAVWHYNPKRSILIVGSCFLFIAFSYWFTDVILEEIAAGNLDIPFNYAMITNFNHVNLGVLICYAILTYRRIDIQNEACKRVLEQRDNIIARANWMLENENEWMGIVHEHYSGDKLADYHEQLLDNTLTNATIIGDQLFFSVLTMDNQAFFDWRSKRKEHSDGKFYLQINGNWVPEPPHMTKS